MASFLKRRGYYYIQYYLGGKQRRDALHTDNLQIAKEKVRQFESAMARNEPSPFPTRTPIAEVLTPTIGMDQNTLPFTIGLTLKPLLMLLIPMTGRPTKLSHLPWMALQKQSRNLMISKCPANWAHTNKALFFIARPLGQREARFAKKMRPELLEQVLNWPLIFTDVHHLCVSGFSHLKTSKHHNHNGLQIPSSFIY